jgi:hypothetical protein
MCSEVMMLVNAGAAAQCPNNQCVQAAVKNGRLMPNSYHVHADGYSGYETPGTTYIGNGQVLDHSLTRHSGGNGSDKLPLIGYMASPIPIYQEDPSPNSDYRFLQNTNEEREFQHTRVSCPPTGDQLLKNRAVAKVLQNAFDLSKSSGVERGGWIYWNKQTGSVFAIIKDPPTRDPLHPERSDTYLKVFLNNPPSPKSGWAIVGVFHTHPETGGPDDWDIGLEFQRKIPGLLIDPKRTWVYGPKRGQWNTDLPGGCK